MEHVVIFTGISVKPQTVLFYSYTYDAMHIT